MIIDFQNIEEKVIENFRGGEKVWLFALADADNKIMMGRLEPGASLVFTSMWVTARLSM